MEVGLFFTFSEYTALRLAQWMAKENARLHSLYPDLPLLYDSGIVYRREKAEKWMDYQHMIAQGHDDCDGLAAARVGEIMFYGVDAIQRGDPGYAAAKRLRPSRIKAECMLKTRTKPGQHGIYHVLCRYRIGGRWYMDDPSARLGMHGEWIDPIVLARWQDAGLNVKGG